MSVEDVGLSDHCLTTAPESQFHSFYIVICSCLFTSLASPRSRFVLVCTVYTEAMDSMPRLCHPDEWPDNVDDMAATYDSKLNAQLVRILSLRRVCSLTALV